MSIFRDFQIPCPGCGVVATRSLAVSVSAARTPQAKQAILDGKFQSFRCEQCGKEYVADGPFIYIDFERFQWIGVYPRGWEESWRSVESEARDSWQRSMVDSAPKMMQQLAGRFVVRALFGLHALRDKLVCLDAGLDDHVLEVLKLDLMRATAGLTLHPAARPRLRAVDEAQLVFDVPVETAAGVADRRLEVERARYDRIAQHRDEWATAFDALGDGSYVDVGRMMMTGDRPRARR
jgi:hypothetical protein